MYNFDPEQLSALESRLAEEFRVARPFRHFMVDGLVAPEVIHTINREFADVARRRADWQRFTTKAEVKFALADLTMMGPTTAAVLMAFNAQPFVGFIERVTGISGIIPDPGYVGGGMHEIASGGFLKIHADFNRHKHLQLDRRLNVILYLNEDWDETWGGHLELWDREMTRAEASIAPLAGRMVCFATDDYSYHGHPDPIRCPEDRFRRSLALYYYTNGRPPEEVSGGHTTLFRPRPGERIPLSRADVMGGLRRAKRRVVGAMNGR